jgi:hypothetical protein
MWNWLSCYLSGRHDFGITCSSGSIYLCCVHCGKRSNGWEVHNEHADLVPVPVTAPAALRPSPRAARQLPFASRDIAPQRRSA